MLRPRASEHEDGVMTSDPGWGFTEAWLLLSIGDHGRPGCTLSTMLGSADARNHDIPTEDAAARALGRLEASGLITSTGGSFSVTKLGRQIRKQRSGGFFEEATSLLPLLAQVPCRDGEHRFEPGEFRAAYEAYARRMRT